MSAQCPECGKELKTAQAVRGHLAFAHQQLSDAQRSALSGEDVASLTARLRAVEARLHAIEKALGDVGEEEKPKPKWDWKDFI